VDVVALIVSVTGRVCGELDALGSDMVAVVLVAPRARPVGFTMKLTVVLAPPASELEAGLKVSQGWVLVADQLSVLLAGPAFVTTTGRDDVAVLPYDAEKLSVEVGTERIAWFGYTYAPISQPVPLKY
jgi:hypothetical protein